MRRRGVTGQWSVDDFDAEEIQRGKSTKLDAAAGSSIAQITACN